MPIMIWLTGDLPRLGEALDWWRPFVSNDIQRNWCPTISRYMHQHTMKDKIIKGTSPSPYSATISWRLSYGGGGPSTGEGDLSMHVEWAHTNTHHTLLIHEMKCHSPIWGTVEWESQRETPEPTRQQSVANKQPTQQKKKHGHTIWRPAVPCLCIFLERDVLQIVGIYGASPDLWRHTSCKSLAPFMAPFPFVWRDRHICIILACVKNLWEPNKCGSTIPLHALGENCVLFLPVIWCPGALTLSLLGSFTGCWLRCVTGAILC